MLSSGDLVCPHSRIENIYLISRLPSGNFYAGEPSHQSVRPLSVLKGKGNETEPFLYSEQLFLTIPKKYDSPFDRHVASLSDLHR
jgi:hypothetical protein